MKKKGTKLVSQNQSHEQESSKNWFWGTSLIDKKAAKLVLRNHIRKNPIYIPELLCHGKWSLSGALTFYPCLMDKRGIKPVSQNQSPKQNCSKTGSEEPISKQKCSETGSEELGSWTKREHKCFLKTSLQNKITLKLVLRNHSHKQKGSKTGSEEQVSQTYRILFLFPLRDQLRLWFPRTRFLWLSAPNQGPVLGQQCNWFQRTNLCIFTFWKRPYFDQNQFLRTAGLANIFN